MPDPVATFPEVYALIRDQGEELPTPDRLEVSERLGFGWQRVVQRKRLHYPAELAPDGREHIFSVTFSRDPQGEVVPGDALLSVTVDAPAARGLDLTSEIFRVAPDASLVRAIVFRVNTEDGLAPRIEDYPLARARPVFESELDFHLRVVFEAGFLDRSRWYTPRYWVRWFGDLLR